MPIQFQFKPSILLSALLSLIISAPAWAGVSAAEKSQDVVPQTAVTSEFVLKYLVGEVAGQRGDLALASNLFLDLANSSRDARLAERAAKAAIFGNNAPMAIKATKLWIELDPDSIEAQQAFTQILISTGNINDAKPYLQKLLAKEDTRANGFLYLNSLLARQPDKGAVLSLVQDLAKPYPNLAEAHFTTGHAAWDAGNADLALSELALANKLHPNWEINAVLQGQVLYSQSPDKALVFYRQFLNKNPGANDARLTFARMLVDQKRFAEAKPEFVKLVTASNNNAEILVVVGLLSIQGGDYKEAESYFQQALSSDFKDKDQIYLYLGQLAEKQKNDAQALAWYDKIEPGERFLDAKINAANIIARTQNTDAAIRMLDDLKDLSNQQLVSVIQVQASLLNQAKRSQEAYTLLGKAVNSLPNTPDLIYDYAMAAERVQQLDISEQELRKLILLKPDFAQAYNALGYSLADRNQKLDEAKKLIEKALALTPDDHYILDSMGWVEYRLGNLDSAAGFLRQAYSAQTDPEIAAHLGEVLWQQGKHDEAMEIWDAALREYPDNEVLISTAKKFK